MNIELVIELMESAYVSGDSDTLRDCAMVIGADHHGDPVDCTALERADATTRVWSALSDPDPAPESYVVLGSDESDPVGVWTDPNNGYVWHAWQAWPIVYSKTGVGRIDPHGNYHACHDDESPITEPRAVLYSVGASTGGLHTA